jgi:general stress protein YciG
MRDFGDGLLQTEAQYICLNLCHRKRCFYDPKITYAERGRRGRRAMAENHGHEDFVKWGRKGGQVSQANLKELRRTFQNAKTG